MPGLRESARLTVSFAALAACGLLLSQCARSAVDAAFEARAEAAVSKASNAVGESATPICPEMAEAPDPLPGVRPEHRSLDYWLERVAATQGDLDEVLLTPEEIQNHNTALLVHQEDRPLGLYDLLARVDVPTLQTSIDERLAWMQEQFATGAYVDRDGQMLPAEMTAAFRPVTLPDPLEPELRMALDLVPFRCGPILDSFYTPTLDLRFDRNNCSSAHPQEVVQVLHRWPNGLLLARTRYTIGWIAPGAALSPPLAPDVAEHVVDGASLVLTEDTRISTDGGESALLPAHTVLSSAGRHGGVYFATATGVHRSDPLPESVVRPTDRPFTRRAVLEEAFTYLGAPYGWGGEGGGRDCSRFLLDLFEAFGFHLPRHSGYQAQAGVFSIDVSGLENEMERMLLIDAAARRGIVLLHFPGHIMLYLGRDANGVPMAMHAFAEYLEPCPEEATPEGEAAETLFTVDDVSVTNLELGRGTSRRSFIERITRIVVLGRTPGYELAGVAELRPAAPVEVPPWRECRDSQEIAIFQTPLSPDADELMRVVATSSEELGPVELALIGPDDLVLRPEVRRFGGPPWGWVAAVDSPPAGGWRGVLGDGSRVEACWRFHVRSDPEPTRTAPEFLAAMAEAEAAGEPPAVADSVDPSTAVSAPPAPSGPSAPPASAVAADADVDTDIPADELDGELFSPPRPLGPVWENARTWGPATENLYATWVESLFSYPPGDDLTWTSLHALLSDRDRNFLYDYLGQGEDDLMTEEEDPRDSVPVLFMQPDCADLPYLLRAYYAWKMRLPYAFRRCARGYAGHPPGCLEINTNLMDRAVEGDAEAFAYFANREVRRAVHSASGRTHPDYEFSDFYPVELTREALMPGTLFADPYGHLLVIVDWVPQGLTDYGMLIGADAQPDGTVGRRRFWRGSFLFSPDTTDVGAGFKAYRPIYRATEGELAGQVVAMDNTMLSETNRFRRISRQQYEGTAEDFYRTMEALINPRPLDPVAMQVSLVDALEEAVSRRVTSVQNGEDYLRATRYATVEMPEGYEIFETIGAWEDYSTPSRDMRLLISIDTVTGFPDRVADEPERYGLRPGVELEEGLAALRARLDQELRSRTFTYVRSDGSPWQLSLRDVVDRQPAFEMAYNPNDCVEIRWAAPENTTEYAPCQRHAPVEQLERMRAYRPWFHDRQRPPR